MLSGKSNHCEGSATNVRLTGIKFLFSGEIVKENSPNFLYIYKAILLLFTVEVLLLSVKTKLWSVLHLVMKAWVLHVRMPTHLTQLTIATPAARPTNMTVQKSLIKITLFRTISGY